MESDTTGIDKAVDEAEQIAKDDCKKQVVVPITDLVQDLNRVHQYASKKHGCTVPVVPDLVDDQLVALYLLPEKKPVPAQRPVPEQGRYSQNSIY